MSASPVALSSVAFNPETRLYIDGQLRMSSTGQTVDNVNPATEEVLGLCTDAGAEDMTDAIAAARRAFDTTDWSTNHELRQRCLQQLHDALQEDKEHMRAELVAEVGCPVSMTYIAQLEWPLADGIALPRRTHLAIRLGAERSPDGRPDGCPLSPRRRQGTDRCRRRDHPVELPGGDHHATRWARSWPPATRWCSNLPSRRRGAHCGGGA